MIKTKSLNMLQSVNNFLLEYKSDKIYLKPTSVFMKMFSHQVIK